ncbi:MAG: hypothetical protein GXP29_01130 [Planctomycetes bacterium]|nr:hypothetical protein [Planctomycetota bacterium]
MNKSRRQKRRAIWMAMALTGSCLAATCQVRTRDALVQGTRSFILNTLLNPLNFVITPPQDANTGGG